MPTPHNITTQEIEAGLRALVSTVRTDQRRLPLQVKELMRVLQDYLGTDIEVNDLADITPETLAEEVTTPWMRQQLIRVLILSAMVDQAPSKTHLKRIAAFAEALEVDEPGLKALELYVRGAHIRLRAHLARNGHAVPQVLEAAKKESRWGVLGMIARVLGLTENTALAARYRETLDYPEGSLGRAYADFIVENGLGFPGEKGTPVEVLAIHDLCHILGGYDIDPASEALVIAFQAGHLSHGAFNYLMLAVFQFHLGFRVTPLVAGTLGQLDIQAAFEALLKGHRMNRDLSAGGWDIQKDLALPLEQVRAKYNITDSQQPTFLVA